MLKFSPEMMRATAEALANAEDFSPEKKEIPESYAKNGQGLSWIKSCWGAVEVKVQRLERRGRWGGGREYFVNPAKGPLVHPRTSEPTKAAEASGCPESPRHLPKSLAT